MKISARALCLAMLTVGLAGSVQAVPPGFSVEFDGNGEGRVIFSGSAHSPGAKPHCADCHMQLFDVSRSAQITRADHRGKQYCFACHDGKTAFAARGKCDRCHVEPLVEPASAPAP